MIDGIKINVQIEDFEKWEEHFHQLDNVSLRQNVDKITGAVIAKELNGKRTILQFGNYRNYKLVVREVINTQPNSKIKYHLDIRGSLHKNYFQGENAESFTFEMMQQEIKRISEDLQFSPQNALIKTLEVGVNIPFGQPVFQWLKESHLLYKTSTFNRYDPDRNGVVLGYHVPLTQYDVKIYDKAKQYSYPKPLLRFEQRFTKMQPLKRYDINYLSDLQDKDKVSRLIELLVASWENVLLFEPIPNTSLLNKRELELYFDGQNPKNWEQWHKKLKYRQYKYKRDCFRSIISQHTTDQHQLILNGIIKEWNTLLGKEQIKLNEFTLYPNSKNLQFPPATEWAC